MKAIWGNLAFFYIFDEVGPLENAKDCFIYLWGNRILMWREKFLVNFGSINSKNLSKWDFEYIKGFKFAEYFQNGLEVCKKGIYLFIDLKTIYWGFEDSNYTRNTLFGLYYIFLESKLNFCQPWNLANFDDFFIVYSIVIFQDASPTNWR